MITPLPFDSELFRYPVGKLDLENDWEEEEFLKNVTDFSLVYLFSKELLPVQDPRIKLVDQKLIFEKSLERVEGLPNMLTYPKKELTPELQALAYQSGIFSRFKTDARLESQEFEKLYSLWIKKALEQDLVLIDSDQNGFVTVAIDQSMAKIGLFAVSDRARGKGIGSQLIQTAEYHALKLGAKTLQIGTQSANEAACNLYRKLGYELADATYVYHFVSSK